MDREAGRQQRSFTENAAVVTRKRENAYIVSTIITRLAATEGCAVDVRKHMNVFRYTLPVVVQPNSKAQL